MNPAHPERVEGSNHEHHPLSLRGALRRGDRTISKNVFITIAKKKQVRSMVTAYKAKLQKCTIIWQKKDPHDAQALLDMVDKAIVNIQSIDPSV